MVGLLASTIGFGIRQRMLGRMKALKRLAIPIVRLVGFTSTILNKANAHRSII